MIRYPLFRLFRNLLLSLLFLSPFQGLLYAQQSTAPGDIPRTLSYQGLLTDGDGVPVADGPYNITVTLYADSEGTRSVWSDTYRADVLGGIFSLYLGDGKRPLPEPDVLNTRLWIGTALNGAPEMRPLTPLAATPYAMNVPDRSITSAKLSDGAVTADKVDLDYVAGVRVNGEEISGKGVFINIRSGDNIDVRYDETTQTLIIESRSAMGAGDSEKETVVLDQTFGTSNNWLGRNPALGGVNHPFYSTPNALTSTYNTLGGGYRNNIRNNADSSTIPGGSRNTILDGSDCGFIGGGCGNEIRDNTNGNVISGGITNAIDEQANLGMIGGGGENTIGQSSDYDVIGGGRGNAIGVTGGASDWGVIGGGQTNSITSAAGHAVIGGGLNNVVSGGEATIGGGNQNEIQGGGAEAFIGGGYDNVVKALRAAIVGGSENDIESAATNSFIGGGEGNLIEAELSVIGGGGDHQILGTASNSVIGGGWSSIIDAPYGTVGGGADHIVTSTAEYSTVAGGRSNRTIGAYSTIGGGEGNITEGDHSTIPGGDRLSTEDSYAQVAVGFFNAPRGNVAPQPPVASLTNDPLFMVGNGDIGNGTATNAFEVSYNGHSTVYHENGPGSLSPAIRGATYTDNVIYAWGLIDGDGTIVCDFGVLSVTHTGPGTYLVKLNLSDPLGEELPMDCMSVTATVKGDQCAFATASPSGGGTPASFTVFTHLFTGGCELEDQPFMFHVTGRP